MKKIVGTLFITVLLVSLFGCNKNQKVVRQLNGEWEVTDYKINGTSVMSADEEGSIKYKFEKCRVNNEDCEGVMTLNDPEKGDMPFPFKYNISEDGTVITIKLSFFGEEDVQKGDIIEHSRSKFVWSYTEDGEVQETTIEKI